MFKSTSVMRARRENGHFLTLITALMAFIAAIIFIAFFVSQKSLKRWDIDLSTNITVQVMPDYSKPADAEKNLVYRTDKASKLLEDKNYLRDVKTLSVEEEKEMLAPWLGESFDFSDIPVPRLIAARVVDMRAFDMKQLTAELDEKVGGVVLEDHMNRLTQVRVIARGIKITIWIIMSLIALGLALAVVYSTKSTLNINRDILEILSNIGAMESYIALIFAKRILFSSLIGGVLGTLVGLPVFMLLNSMLSGVLGYELVEMSDLWYLAIIPVSITAISLGTAELTVYSKLKKLYN